MMALVNANYEFIMVEAGTNGRVSDGGVFSQTKFKERLLDEELNLPDHEKLPMSEEALPFVIVADDAFPLMENLLKPYSHLSASNEQRIFNYRLSRARRIVENVFGILASRFRILLNTINLSPEKATTIVLSCCYLHNFLKKRNPNNYLKNSVDVENVCTGDISNAPWHNDIQLQHLQPLKGRNSTVNCKEIRNKFCNYFNTVGAVPWQNQVLHN